MSGSKRSDHSGATPPRASASSGLSPPLPVMHSPAHAAPPPLSAFPAAHPPPVASLAPPPGPVPKPSAELSPMPQRASAQSAPLPSPAPGPQPLAPVPVQLQAPLAPPRRVPATIDGRPAVHVRTTDDGRRVYEPQRNSADPSEGTSPFPHYSAAADGGPGHLSDLSVHAEAVAPSTIARYRQTYVAAPGGPKPPKSRTDRYADTNDGRPQRHARGEFTPDPEAAPLSPRTLSNAAARTSITFRDEDEEV